MSLCQEGGGKEGGGVGRTWRLSTKREGDGVKEGEPEGEAVGARDDLLQAVNIR